MASKIPFLSMHDVNGDSVTGSSASTPKVVAGIRIVDSKIASEATALSKECSPAYLFNHSMRTFLFGSLLGNAGKLNFDQELLYLACTLHDLGLTERFMGDMPFEIQGAEAARSFLEAHGISKSRAEIVWDGIAMHASAIGAYKQPEIALVGAGAAADVVGADLSQLPVAAKEEVLKAFPRLDFKNAFIKSCSGVIKRYPRGASRSFMRDIGERYVSDFHVPNICDAIKEAPFSE